MKKIFDFPIQIFELVLLFSKHHFEIYLVGGSVRDLYLGKIPNDFDFATSALPCEMKNILQGYKTYNIGEKYGTINVIFPDFCCEITTFRSEGGYLDSRHPQKVVFEKNLIFDLKRRDFTINAIAYDFLTNEVIDYFSGLYDLKNKLISCVGNPNERFKEDALRILRAFSLIAKYNFTLSKDTLEAIIKQKKLINTLSKERITSEMNKIFAGKYCAKALKIMQKKQILDIYFIPKKIDKIPKKYRIYLLSSISNYPFCLKNKEMQIIKNILKKLVVKKSIKQRMWLFARLKSEFETKYILIALYIKIASAKKALRLKKGFSLRLLEQKIKINGFDLQKLGYKGEKIKKIKQQLIIDVLSKKLPNNKHQLFKKVAQKVMTNT